MHPSVVSDFERNRADAHFKSALRWCVPDLAFHVSSPSIVSRPTQDQAIWTPARGWAVKTFSVKTGSVLLTSRLTSRYFSFAR